MSEELTELQEHAEHAKHDPTLAPITVTMAVLAVLVAIVTLLGHRAHTEEVVLQAKSSDQWAFYQAKNIRRHTDELFTDLTSVEATTDAAAHIEEVGRAAAGVLDDVHSGHGQTRAVHHAAHRAIELDVIQPIARGLH